MTSEFSFPRLIVPISTTAAPMMVDTDGAAVGLAPISAARTMLADSSVARHR
jgi:hypothetical protein